MMEPITFRGKGDWSFYLQLGGAAVAAAAGIGSFFLYGNYLWLGIGLAFLVVFGVGLAQLLNTRYILDEIGLDARSGISKIRVDYKNITDADAIKEAKVSGYVPMAMSRRKLYLIFAEGENTYRLELSPEDQGAFLEALRLRMSGR